MAIKPLGFAGIIPVDLTKPKPKRGRKPIAPGKINGRNGFAGEDADEAEELDKLDTEVDDTDEGEPTEEDLKKIVVAETPSNNTPDGELGIYFRQIPKGPLLTPREEKALAKISKGKGPKAEKAQKELVERNLRLVVTIARPYMGLGLDISDLVSEGNLGLHKAVQRFDPDKGAKLSTYAAWWIRQHLRRALSNQSRTVRMPVHAGDKINKINRIASQMANELEREPTHQEIAEETGIPERIITKLMENSPKFCSLDSKRDPKDSSGETLGDTLPDESSESPGEMAEFNNSKEQLYTILETLPTREKEILTARYGLDGRTPQTLEQVGRRYRVTRERIRQLQNLALEKLRFRMEKNPRQYEMLIA